MSTKNMTLTDHFNQFVSNAVSTGRYHSASEVVRAGLRLLENQEILDQEKLANLQKITQDSFSAMNRGVFSTFSFDEIADSALPVEKHG